jgi:uncharacterized protein (DUF58 family)
MSSSSCVQWLGKSCFGAGLIALVLLGIGWLEFGSPARAVAFLRGERLLIEPPGVQLGLGIPGQKRTVHFVVTNLDSFPVRIVGSSTACTCVSVDNLPVEIAAGGTKQVVVNVTFPKQPEFNQDVLFFTDSRRQPRLIASVSGSVSEPHPSD